MSKLIKRDQLNDLVSLIERVQSYKRLYGASSLLTLLEDKLMDSLFSNEISKGLY